MQQLERSLKVSIHVADGDTHRGFATAPALLDFLFYRGIAGVTVSKGVAGFGADHHLHTASLVDVADRLPVTIEFVDLHEKVEALLPKLKELCGTGMIEVQETNVVKAWGGRPYEASEGSISRKVEGKAKLLRIYLDETDKWHDKPLFQALIEALRAHDIAGATVHKAILGYGSGKHVHQRHTFSAGASLIITVIDAEEKIKEFTPLLDKMLPNGLVVLSEVDVVTYRRVTSEKAAAYGENTSDQGRVQG